MPENLEEFLGKSKVIKENFPEVDGSFGCQECNEIVTKGMFDEDSGIIIWYCSENHKSQVSI